MPPMVDRGDVGLAGIRKIQAFIYPRRTRLQGLFNDFDPLRCGCVTRTQFERVISMVGVLLSAEEIDGVIVRFEQDKRHPKARGVQSGVCYDAFIAETDEIFKNGDGGLLSPTRPNQGTRAHDELLSGLLARVSQLCSERGVVFRSCFTAMEPRTIATPTFLTPRTSGKMSRSVFFRAFPFTADFTEEELDYLVDQYSNDCGDVYYNAMINAVAEVPCTEMKLPEQKGLSGVVTETRWSHQMLGPMEKIRSRVVERRVRLNQQFRDFDALRKGCCTVGQLKTVLSILNLWKDIDRNGFEALCDQYVKEDGMFCYASFCADVDQAFTLPGLQKDPMIGSKMPSADTTAAARRSRMPLNHLAIQRSSEVEEKLRQRIKVRRIVMRTYFQDVDKTRTGHVTRSQFTRIMSALGLGLDEATISALCMVYCDLGNSVEFNYMDFCSNLESRPEMEPPSWSPRRDQFRCVPLQGPHQLPQTPKYVNPYFDSFGHVRPATAM
jgi:Ca2+-binding EF-hand superfamily protein